MLNHACTLIVNPRSGEGGGVLEKRSGFTDRWQYASGLRKVPFCREPQLSERNRCTLIYEEISSHLTGFPTFYLMTLYSVQSRC